ncbi:MAG: hypothetical protein ACM3QZ_02545 [Solirubrobacterales bacterium]
MSAVLNTAAEIWPAAKTAGLIFFASLAATSLGTLSTLFLSRQVVKPVYLITFLDALIAASVLRSMSSSRGLYFIVAFALGKTVGVFVGQQLERWFAPGYVELTVYKHPDDGARLADRLRERGYSVTTQIGSGQEGRPRMVLMIFTPRRALPDVKRVLFDEGKVHMAIKPVAGTYGKIGQVAVHS